MAAGPGACRRRHLSVAFYDKACDDQTATAAFRAAHSLAVATRARAAKDFVEGPAPSLFDRPAAVARMEWVAYVAGRALSDPDTSQREGAVGLREIRRAARCAKPVSLPQPLASAHRW